MTLRRIDGPDAVFLAGETSEWHFHVSALQIVDTNTAAAGFDFDTFRNLLRRRLHLVPQFRWQLVGAPLGLGWSWFTDAVSFDVDDHLHHIAVPKPGGRDEVDALVGELVGQKIDRSRPLWDMWFIDGLADGRVAILIKVHHAIVDGSSGVDVASALFDLTPDAPDDEDPPPYAPGRRVAAVEISARNALNLVRVPARVVRLGGELVRQGLASLPVAFGRDAPAMPFQAPATIFNGQLTARRAFASANLPLSLVKQIRHAAGVTVNDVVLTVCAGALRSYLHARGGVPDRPLIAQVPVSTRTEASRADVGTQVGSMFVSLATDLDDPAERLRAVHDSATAAKHLRGTMAEHHSLGVSDALPPALFAVAARVWSLAHLDARTPPIYNVIISNVAGPPVDFYIAGARVEAMYAMGPLLYGGGLNITVFSNGGTMDVGVSTCRDLVPDPQQIAEAFEPALHELAVAILGSADAKPGKRR